MAYAAWSCLECDFGGEVVISDGFFTIEFVCISWDPSYYFIILDEWQGKVYYTQNVIHIYRK